MKATKETEFKRTELGMIPEDWQVRSTEELLLPGKGSIKIGPFGSQLKKSFFVPNGFKVYGQENIFANNFAIGTRYVSEDRFEMLQSCELEPGDFVISMMGTVGLASIVPGGIEKGIMDSHLLRLRFDGDKVDKEFLLYTFMSKSTQNQISSSSVGTIMEGLNSGIIRRLTFPYPPLDEQKRIASMLSCIDAEAGVARQMNRTLEKIAKALFKHWFVDFDFPNEEGKPYKSSGGRFIESEYGEIPMGWEAAPLDQVAEFTRGFSYKGSEKSIGDGEYLFVTLNSVKEGGGFKREFSFVSSGRLKERHFVQSGDIVIANTEQTKTGTLLGCPALVEFPLGYQRDRAVISHHITKVVPKQPSLKYFLYFFLLFHQQEAVQYNTGSVIWALDVVNWARQEGVSTPPPKLIDLFNRLVDPIMRSSWENNLQAEVLAGLRDALLPKLISGTIRVPIEAN